MRTVLIAHHDTAFASRLSAAVLDAGYRTIICPGPWPPATRCIRCDVGYCPLTEGADLLVYDPELVGKDDRGFLHTLAVDTARAHPEVPVLLAWVGEDQPASVEAIRAEVSRIGIAARDPRALAYQVEALIGPPVDPSIVQVEV